MWCQASECRNQYMARSSSPPLRALTGRSTAPRLTDPDLQASYRALADRKRRLSESQQLYSQVLAHRARRRQSSGECLCRFAQNPWPPCSYEQK
jgi:hypothetical protein